MTVLDFTRDSRTHVYQRQSDECLPAMVGRMFTREQSAVAVEKIDYAGRVGSGSFLRLRWRKLSPRMVRVWE